MNNIILGSGIIGLLAKSLLPSWKIIPFKESRFYSYSLPLCDNYIMVDKEITSFIQDLVPDYRPLYNYSRGWSINGHIFKEFDSTICEDWLIHTFGSEYSTHIKLYLANKMQFQVYNIRINQLYEQLMRANLPEIKSEGELGSVTEIGDHYIVRGNKKLEFDNAISTIPLNALNSLSNRNSNLTYKPIYYIRIETNKLDFEKCNQLFVVDRHFSFFKVSQTAPNQYLFYCNEDIPTPGPYFMPIIQNFDIIDGCMIADGIPCGGPPKLESLEKLGIYCVGSYAQHDWCMDVGSCILRLLRYAKREYKSGVTTVSIDEHSK